VPCEQYTSKVGRDVCTTEKTTESRVSITKTCQNVVEKGKPYQSENRRRRHFCIRGTVYQIYQRQKR